LTYDAVAFHAYLEVLIASNTVSASGGPKQHQSPWLLTEAANTIFTLAKRRCFVSTPKQNKIVSEDQDEHAWEALDEIQGTAAGSGSKAAKRRTWLPDGMDPVLEELPKWTLLAAILHEIEEEQMRQESLSNPREPHTQLTSFLTDGVG
jgi:DNA excision repair protein ERCC-4